MRYRVLLVLTGLITAGLLLSACGGGDDDDAGATPGGGTAVTTTPGGAPATTATGGGGAQVSVSIELSGQVKGEFELSGMGCDFFPNSADTDADDAIGGSISGTADGDEYTITISGQVASDEISVRLTRSGGQFGGWDNDLATGVGADPDAGTVTITDEGGSFDVTLTPKKVDPGSATEDVALSGSWTCPNGEYKPLG